MVIPAKSTPLTFTGPPLSNPAHTEFNGLGPRNIKTFRTANVPFDCGIGPCVWPRMLARARNGQADYLYHCVDTEEFRAHDGQVCYLYHRDVPMPARARTGQADYLCHCVATVGSGHTMVRLTTCIIVRFRCRPGHATVRLITCIIVLLPMGFFVPSPTNETTSPFAKRSLGALGQSTSSSMCTGPPRMTSYACEGDQQPPT